LFDVYDIDDRNPPLTVRESGKVSRILNYLTNNKSVNAEEVSDMLEKTRLSAIIFKLKKRGFNITSEYAYEIDESGKRKTIVTYILND
jgi:predicted nucleic acid-binding Zn ribbon protein